jgi:RNA polymerase-interacting CarD/CdnL/TRCF family regulator
VIEKEKLMAAQTHRYDAGQWIVHRYHGVGEIECIEEMKPGGSPTAYYKVVTAASTVWVPLAEADDDLFRPLASPEEFEEVLAILQRPPRAMHQNHMNRRHLIDSVHNGNSLHEVARLLRDLWGRRAERGLNGTEEQALRQLIHRLLDEWSAMRHVDEVEAESRMRRLLQQGLDKVAGAA